MRLTSSRLQVALADFKAEFGAADSKPPASLDTLCADLQRVQTAFTGSLLIESDEFESDENEAYVLSNDSMCCRMLGACNGRTEFATSDSLSWDAQGSLCSNTACK